MQTTQTRTMQKNEMKGKNFSYTAMVISVRQKENEGRMRRRSRTAQIGMCTDREKECCLLADSFCCLYVIKTDFVSFLCRRFPSVSDRR